MFLDAEKETQVNRLVREYLHYADYPTALSAFDVECRLKGRAGTDASPDHTEMIESSEVDYAMNQFLLPFTEGEHDNDFPASLRESDPLYQRMEFQLSIYFAIFPLHPNVNQSAAKKVSVQKSMEAFKHFLETRGADLCKTTQFLSYYALPYVPDPRKHPSFGDLFTERYVKDLEDRLKHFLGMALKAENPLEPKLKEKDVEIKALKKSIRELESSESDLKIQQRRLYEDYHNLITIASELVQTLATAINGEKDGHINTELEQDRKIPTPLELKPPISSARASPYKPEMNPRSSSNSSSGARDEPRKIRDLEAAIDFEKIKQDLSEGGGDNHVQLQSLLLQALRKNMISNPRNKSRRNVLKEYVRYDFIGLRSSVSTINSVFSSQSSYPKEQLSKLMNVMASECLGREYLLRAGGQAVSTLFTAMKGERTDSKLFQNLIGTLQKLSLRRQAQTVLNRLNAINTLLDILESFDKYSDYSVEYSVALLMNLCLRTAGRKQCLRDPERVLGVLADLIQTENPQILTYVNGTLYSILAEPEIRECAREMRQAADDSLNGQIDFVLDQLASEEQPDSDAFSEDGDEEDHEDEEVDLIEDDDDDIPFDLITSDLTGDALLVQRYATVTTTSRVSGSGGMVRDASSPLRQSSSSINTRKPADEIMKRPRTPASRPQTPSGSPVRGEGRGKEVGDVGGRGNGGEERTRYEERKEDKVGRKDSGDDRRNDERSETEKDSVGPIVVNTGRGKMVPTTELEYVDIVACYSLLISICRVKEFTVGFSSKPKIPRTPEY
ncbi:hypothetical protein BC829DRAFT_393725 [Chytridium lagenaria]|nr:hypothetical protein BC829DRAFT_393725 [Chytridium lagenaria]